MTPNLVLANQLALSLHRKISVNLKEIECSITKVSVLDLLDPIMKRERKIHCTKPEIDSLIWEWPSMHSKKITSRAFMSTLLFYSLKPLTNWEIKASIETIGIFRQNTWLDALRQIVEVITWGYLDKNADELIVYFSHEMEHFSLKCRRINGDLSIFLNFYAPDQIQKSGVKVCCIKDSPTKM